MHYYLLSDGDHLGKIISKDDNAVFAVVEIGHTSHLPVS